MGDIVTKFADGFTGILEPIANGLKTGFSNLLYVDPNAEVKVLSDVAEVGLIIGGMALAVGLVMGIFHFVRRLKG